MTSRVERIRRSADVALIVLFVAAIGLPVVDMIFKLDKTPNTEGRRLAPPPKLALTLDALKQLPADLKAWTADHFGFRNLMIRWHGIMKVHGLDVSSSPQVVLGKRETSPNGSDGPRWLYYSAYNTMEYHLARVPFTEAELEQWKETLEARRDWLAARGCRYVFVIAPNAQSIYPEFLPDEYQRVGARSRADELIDYLRQHSTVEVVDTRQSQLDSRRSNPSLRIYHRTDTHWNDAGSFLAYRQIAEHLGRQIPSMKPLAFEQFDIVRRTTEGGDLAGVLGIKNHFTEERIDLEFRPPLVRKVPRERYDDGKLIVENAEAASRGAPVMVMFRDSFGATLQPFLAEHFAKSVFIWSDQFHPEYVEEHRPQVVITQMVERFFWRKPPEK